MQQKQLHKQNPFIQADSLILHVEDRSVLTEVTGYRPAVNSLELFVCSDGPKERASLTSSVVVFFIPVVRCPAFWPGAWQPH